MADDIIDDVLRELRPHLTHDQLQRTAYELRQRWGGKSVYIPMTLEQRAARKRAVGVPEGRRRR